MPTASFGPVGISVATGAGTGANDKRIQLGTVQALLAVYAVVPASSGPVWCTLQVRSASQVVAGVGGSGWLRGDPNFGGSDFISWQGVFPLSPQGGNEVIPLIRNDSGSTVTVAVGGLLEL